MSATGLVSTSTPDVSMEGEGGDATTLQQLRAECEKSWAKVKDTQHQLERSVEGAPHSSAAEPNRPPLLAILRKRERRLRAELQVLKQLSPQPLPNDPQVVETVLLDDLLKEVFQLTEEVALVDSQRQELQVSIQKEQLFEQQLLAVKEKLQDKRDSVEAQDPPEDPVEMVAQELESKITAAQKTEQTIMKRMAEFVAKHFPIPDPEQVGKTSKELRSRKHQTRKETLPLKDILLELMTKCVEHPEDPYMTVDERHWPAYIELLLRCNIVLHHPDDDRRIKLVPFHL